MIYSRMMKKYTSEQVEKRLFKTLLCEVSIENGSWSQSVDVSEIDELEMLLTEIDSKIVDTHEMKADAEKFKKMTSFSRSPIDDTWRTNKYFCGISSGIVFQLSVLINFRH